MWEDFKKFALQGNVLDLAVAVVLGAAFGAIVTSLVDNIIMPIVGAISGGIDFTGLAIRVGSAEILYGTFIQSIIDFFLIAASIFIFIRFVMRKKQEEEEEEVDTHEVLLTEIRDLLKNQDK